MSNHGSQNYASTVSARDAQICRIAGLFRELDRPVESRASRLLKAALTALTIGIAYAVYSPLGRRLPDQINFFVHAGLTIGAVTLIAKLWPRFRNLNFFLRVVVGAFVLVAAVVVSTGVKKWARPALTPEQLAQKEARLNRPGRRVQRDVPLLQMLKAMKRGDLYVITHGDLETVGRNWKILTSHGAYALMTHAEAKSACEALGEGFKIPTSDEMKTSDPAPVLPGAMSFWLASPGSAAQLNRNPSVEISVYTHSKNADATRQVLCWKAEAP